MSSRINCIFQNSLRKKVEGEKCYKVQMIVQTILWFFAQVAFSKEVIL